MPETWVRSLGWEDSRGVKSGNALQHSCLENPMDREAWRATVQGVTQSRTRLSEHTGSKASFYDGRIGAWIYLDEQRQFLTKKFRFGCQNILQRPPQPVANCSWFPVKPGAILPPGNTWQYLVTFFGLSKMCVLAPKEGGRLPPASRQ